MFSAYSVLGIPVNDIYSKSKLSQKRLHEMLLIINRVSPWCGSGSQAFAWYCSEPIPGFGELTAGDIVNRGQIEGVVNYLNQIAEGGYS